jgi:zinc protease
MTRRLLRAGRARLTSRVRCGIRCPWRTSVLPLATLLLLTAAVGAQTQKRAQFAHAGRLMMDSAVTIGTLANGLRYYIRPNAVPAHRAEFRLVVDAGSALEDEDQRGLAHFVEHMAFNGTTHFKKLDIVRYLEAVGMKFGADLNAETTPNETVYRITVPTDRADALPTGTQILADWGHGIVFDSAAVEAERGIVLGEWRSRTDAGGLGSRITERYLGELLRGSRYVNRMPIGVPEIIERAPRAELVRFYHDWYRPDRMAVVVVGDVDVKATEALIRHTLGSIPRAGKGRARPSLTVPAPSMPAYAVVADSQVGNGGSVTATYRLQALAHGTREGFRQALVDRMVAYILSERLSDLDRGTIGIEEPVRDVRTYTLRAPARDGDTEGAFVRLLGMVRQVVEHGFTPDELGRVREYSLTEYENAFMRREAISSSVLADGYAMSFLTGAIVQPIAAALAMARENLTGVNAIGLADLNSVARAAFAPARRVILLAASPTSKATLLTEQSVTHIADSVARASTPTYATEVQSIPLVATPPTPGSIDSVHTLAAIGAQEWVLSNGVRVILKPTDFNRDQLLVQAIAPGGTSLAADSDYVSAQLATQALATSGLGAFTLPLLQKRLRSAGSSVSLTPSIGELNQGLTANASPRDAATLLQMIHLAFTAPRADSVPIARWQATMREQLSTAQAVMAQKIHAIVIRGNPRARPVTAAMVDSLDPARALEFRRARFADASAFTFYIVGAFDPDSMRPFIKRWIASLPATHAHETWRDVGVRPIGGPFNIDAPMGPAGKTTIQLALSGTMTYEPQNTVLLNALSEVAQRRLLDRLRTELHATYGVQVGATAARWPYPHYEIDVSFDAAPEQADSLVRAAIAVLDTLRANGPTAQEVADVKTLEERRIQVGRRDNGYWLATLATDGWNGWDYGVGITDADALLGTLTLEPMKAAADRFFDTGHVLRIAIRPYKVSS